MGRALVSTAASAEPVHLDTSDRETSSPKSLRPRESFPLSFGQQALWRLATRRPESSAYNVSLIARVRGPLCRAALRRSLRRLVHRHPMLRAIFRQQDGRPEQTIGQARSEMVEIDAEGLTLAHLRAAVRRAHATLFDLTEGPPWRALLWRLDKGDHVLQLTVHHIVCDGWSIWLVMNELLPIYEAEREGRHLALPEPAASYADFVDWEARRVESAAGIEHLRYWQKTLAGELAPPSLPARTRDLRTRRCAVAALAIDPDTGRALHELGRQAGATLFAVLLAGFKALLYRLTGDRDLLVGMPTFGRSLPGFASIVGDFVHPVLIRTRASGRRPFSALLDQVRQSILGALAHRDFPFPLLAQRLGLERRGSLTSMLNCMFVLQRSQGSRRLAELLAPTGSEIPYGDLTLRFFDFVERDCRFDLTVEMVEFDRALHLVVKADHGLFGKTFPRRFATHLHNLLRAVAADPTRPLADLPWLSRAEVHQLRFAWRDVSPSTGDEACLVRRFAVRASRCVDAIALQGESSLSYGTLAAEARRLAGRLNVLGIGSEDRVGLCLPPSIEAVIAILGILGAGACYVPLRPEDPPRRRRQLAADSRLEWVVTDGSEWPWPDTVTPLTFRPGRRSGGADRPFPLGNALVDRAAYVIHTSGSTGRPKGVVIDHRQVLQLFAATSASFELGSLDVWSLFHSTSFDFSVWEIWGALLHGGRLVVVPRDTRREPVALGRLLEDQRITVLSQTPTAFRQLVHLPLAHLALRWVVFGGEALDPAILRPWLERGGRNIRCVRWANLYGITEGTVHSTCRELLPSTSDDPRQGGIGRPLPGRGVWILDPSLRLLPIGVAGELCLSGAGLARGYQARAAATAERFVPDPHSDDPTGGRLFCTGDRARLAGDGRLEYLGRLDHQIKIHGFRIEPGEIEATLLRQDVVREAAVIADRGRAHGNRRLVAYLALQNGHVGNGFHPASSNPSPEPQAQEQHVEHWRKIYEDLYAGAPASSPTIGWNRSVDGQPFPSEEMDEWVAQTVQRIRELGDEHARILEIGCGTGLLLRRLAPNSRAYLGTDIAAKALRGLRAGGLPPQVRLAERAADDFTGIEPASFNLVILNSVIQYFPSAAYLQRVLRRAVEAVAPGGALFLGDVRHFGLLEAFATSVETARLPSGATWDELRQQVARRVQRQEELLVDPAFFTALRQRLPRISTVRVRPKHGRFTNELNTFRYDVILHLDDGTDELTRVEVDWRRDRLAEDWLEGRLAEIDPEAALILRGVPNRRLWREGQITLNLWNAADDEGVDEALAEIATRPSEGLDPSDWEAIASRLGRRAETSWASGGSTGEYDVYLAPAGTPHCFDHRPESSPGSDRPLTNDPLLGQAARKHLPRLRQDLRQTLPDFMQPAAFVVLAALPRLPTGKLDRAALPTPDDRRPLLDAEYTAPRSAIERSLAETWAEFLGLRRVGMDDNFFELGGDSILGIQMVSRAREQGLAFDVGDLFRHQTIAELAAAIEERENRRTTALSSSPAPAEAYPLSPLQAGVLFHTLEAPEASFYIEQCSWTLTGSLEPDRLRQAWSSVLARHDILRTYFVTADSGEPRQRVAPEVVLPWRERSLVEVDAAFETTTLDSLTEAECREGFDLARPPLMRLLLVRLRGRRWRMIWTFHHLLLDGWSWPLLMREVITIYRARGRGEEPRLATPFPYRRYIEHLATRDRRAEESFWRQQLRGLDSPTPLPLDLGRPGDRRSHALGRREGIRLAPEKDEALRALARRERLTLNTLVLGAWALLLSRYAGTRDILFGVSVSGRAAGIARPESMIGLFLNTLPGRVQLDENTPIFRWLRRLQRLQVQLRSHDASALFEIQRWSELPPEMPLFESCFVFDNFPIEEHLELWRDEFQLDAFHWFSKINYPLLLLGVPDGGLKLFIAYEPERFESTGVHRVLRQLERILASWIERPRAPLGETSLLSRAERHQMHFEWNDPKNEEPFVSVHQRIAEQGRTRPHATAVSWDGTSGGAALSYGQLLAQSTTLARQLVASGVGVDSLVGVEMERSPEMIVALLAVMASGGAWLSLEASMPRQRRDYIRQDARLARILNRRETRTLSTPRHDPLALSPSQHDRQAHPEEPAYVIYTSGTTGWPKGSVIPRRAIANRVQWELRATGLGPGDRMLQRTPLGFDVSVAEIYSALAAGAELVLSTAGLSDPGSSAAAPPDLAALLRWIECRRVTSMHLVPSLLEALVSIDSAPASWSSLRRVLTSGEALPSPLVRRVQQLLHRAATLFNLYGPTEATITMTAWQCPRPDPGAMTIGRPIDQASISIVDPRLREVPPGAVGELAISGVPLASSYLRRPALTATLFVPDPHGVGTRLYRSGDLGRWRDDGLIDIFGRRDQQVKIRGQRIELGEIEQVLAEHPAIRETVVALRTGKTGRELIAYVVRGDCLDGEQEQEQIRRWQAVYDSTYDNDELAEEDEFAGWRSSYTGEPIAAAEMAEWAAATTERVRALGPQRVLEIGCGTGLILRRLAQDCSYYLGTDFARAPLDGLARWRRQAGLKHVELQQRAADDFDGLPERAFDLVLLSSVVQYFPSVDYLVRVLRGAARVLAEGGRIVLADLRSLPLHDLFCTSIECFRASDTTSVEALRQRIESRRVDEKELLLAPALFPALRAEFDRLNDVWIRPRRGLAKNEMTLFRYDVVLTFGKPQTFDEPPPLEFEWMKDFASLEALESTLRQTFRHEPRPVRLRVPDRRLAPEITLRDLITNSPSDSRQTCGDLRRIVNATEATGILPDELEDLAERLGARLSLEPTARPTSPKHVAFDGLSEFLLHPRKTWPGFKSPRPNRPGESWSAYGNDPLAGRWLRDLAPRLEEALKPRLPEAFLPSRFMPLARLPRLTSGKVDRRGLPKFKGHRQGSASPTFSPARTPTEDILTEIWHDVLVRGDRGRLGIDEDFFRIGGHSLLATQLAAKIQRVFGTRSTPRLIFEHPTIRALAAEIDRRLKTSREPASNKTAANGTRVDNAGFEALLNFAQQRLWFLEQLRPGDPAYHFTALFRFRGMVRPDALGSALEHVVHRHAALRTTFHNLAGQPRQRPRATRSQAAPRLLVVDLSQIRGGRERAVRRLVSRIGERGFDLERGPLLRCVLIRSGTREDLLAYTVHHIIWDGWSTGIFHRELVHGYDLAQGRDVAPLPDLVRTFPAHADLEQRCWSANAHQAEFIYWRERLADQRRFSLPTDRPRRPYGHRRGGAHGATLDRELVRAMKAVGQQAGATLFMTALAAFSAFLSRLCDASDLTLGTPMARRDGDGAEHLIGLLVDTLALRLKLGPNPPFNDILAHAREACLGAFIHRGLPFDKLVEDLRPPRDASRHPLFQISLALQNAPLDDLRLGASTAELLEQEPHGVRFELELYLIPRREGLEARLVFDQSLFDRTSIQRWTRSFLHLLTNALASTSTRLSDLPLLAANERHQLLHAWSGPGENHPGASTSLHALFAERARRSPDAVAVTRPRDGEPSWQWTYRTLAAWARSVARQLGEARREQLIGLLADRSPEMVASMLGILHAGAAFLPISPTDPHERQLGLLRDASVRQIFAPEALPHLAAEVQVNVPDRPCPEASRDAESPPVSIEPDNLAYVLYTSGSTGRPKGVAIPHRGIVHYLAWAAAFYGAANGRCAPVFTQVTSDLTLTALWAPLLAGSGIRLLDPRDDPRRLDHPEELFVDGPSLVKLTPAHLRAIPADRPQVHWRGLLVVGGEALGGDLVERLRRFLPAARWVNEYGPTETTVGSLAYVLPPGTPPTSVPIGRPITGTFIRLLDRFLNPLPIGAIGELCIGGVGLARGYIAQPGRTAAAFVPDPFDAGGRLYRTGDLVVWRPDGLVVFRGRRDRQVKIRGFRIEPAEIETCLRHHPSVRDVVVVPRARDEREGRLVAHIETGEAAPEGDTGEPRDAVLRAHVRERLPSFMWPSIWCFHKALPRLTNGKVDAAALPAAPRLRPGSANDFRPPRTRREKRLIAIWCQVLEVEKIGLEDNFFELGGDSLLAVRLVDRCRRAGFTLTVRDLFERQTPAELVSA